MSNLQNKLSGSNTDSSSLSKTVNKTKVGTNETFTYTISSSVSSIQTNVNSAKIEDFIPNNVNYTLPPIAPPIASITKTPQDGGTLITFNLDTNNIIGSVSNINIGASFAPGTAYGTSFTNNSTLYLNGSKTASASAQPVTLVNKADFKLEKQLLSPVNQNPSPGSSVIYAIHLKNLLEAEGGTGMAGGNIKNVSISDKLPSWLTVDSSFTPIGKDLSPYNPESPQYDGLKGTVDTANNSINFTLPSYDGTDYVIYFKAKVNPDVKPGTILNNTANWNNDGAEKTPASNSVTVASPTAQSNVSKGGPHYSSPGDPIIYNLTPNNVGNTDLSNVSMIDNIPSGFTPTSVTTGAYTLTEANAPANSTVKLEYSTDGGTTYTTIGTYTGNSDTTVPLPKLPENEKYTQIKWVISKLPLGINIGNGPKINGTLSSDYSSSTLTNTASTVYTDSNGNTVTSPLATVTTNISNKSIASLGKSVDKTSADPGSEINYTLNASIRTPLTGPILADLLPAGVSFNSMTNNLYYNGVTEQSTTNLPITVTTVKNFNNTGRTLVRFTFPKDYKLAQNSSLAIYFSAQIGNTTSGVLSNTAVLGNSTGTVEPPNGTPPTTDNNDLLGNGIGSQPVVSSNPTSTTVAGASTVASKKLVKGALDQTYSSYPQYGKTTEGGSLEYKIILKNTTNVNYSAINIIDIFPHVSDTGVIVNQARGSQFPVSPTGPATAVIDPADPNNPNPDLEIQYSTSYDPKRFTANNLDLNATGTGTWTSSIPTPATDIAALKLTAPKLILKPGQSIVISIPAKVPAGIKPGEIAWNSFAYTHSQYSPDSDSYVPQQAAEPFKVGITVEDNTPPTPPEPPTPPTPPTEHCSQSVIDIIESVALEETALSHIINAEGEKIQKMLTLNPTKQDILNVNCSVKNTIAAITKLELVLSQKLATAKKLCASKVTEDTTK